MAAYGICIHEYIPGNQQFNLLPPGTKSNTQAAVICFYNCLGNITAATDLEITVLIY